MQFTKERASKLTIHPNAYLSSIRNVKSGLIARSKIINEIRSEGKSVKEIASSINMSYSSVLRHIKHLERERIIERFGEGKPFKWRKTHFGQQTLQI